jgi:serine/threonine protein kinase
VYSLGVVFYELLSLHFPFSSSSSSSSSSSLKSNTKSNLINSILNSRPLPFFPKINKNEKDKKNNIFIKNEKNIVGNVHYSKAILNIIMKMLDKVFT